MTSKYTEGYRLIVLDTLSRIHQLNENSNGDMGFLIAWNCLPALPSCMCITPAKATHTMACSINSKPHAAHRP